MLFWYFSGSWKNVRIISPIFSMNKFRQSKVKDVFFPQIQAEHVGFHSSKNFQNWLLVSHYIKKYWLFGGLMCLETINDHEVWAVWQWRTHSLPFFLSPILTLHWGCSEMYLRALIEDSLWVMRLNWSLCLEPCYKWKYWPGENVFKSFLSRLAQKWVIPGQDNR